MVDYSAAYGVHKNDSWTWNAKKFSVVPGTRINFQQREAEFSIGSCQSISSYTCEHVVNT